MKPFLSMLTFGLVLFFSTFASAQQQGRDNQLEVRKSDRAAQVHIAPERNPQRALARRRMIQRMQVRNYRQMAMADGRVTRSERKLIRRSMIRANNAREFRANAQVR